MKFAILKPLGTILVEREALKIVSRGFDMQVFNIFVSMSIGILDGPTALIVLIEIFQFQFRYSWQERYKNYCILDYLSIP